MYIRVDILVFLSAVFCALGLASISGIPDPTAYFSMGALCFLAKLVFVD